MMGALSHSAPEASPPEHPPSPFFPSESHSPPARLSQPLGTKLPNLLPKGLPGRKLAATAKNPVADAPKRFFPESVPPPLEPEAPAPPPVNPFRLSRSLGGSGGALRPAAQPSSAEVTLRDLDPHSEATQTEINRRAVVAPAGTSAPAQRAQRGRRGRGASEPRTPCFEYWRRSACTRPRAASCRRGKPRCGLLPVASG
jgi:hypothetical protein